MKITEFENQKEIFTTTIINNSVINNVDFNVVLCGYECADSSKKTVYPSAYYALHFLIAGNLILTINDKKVILPKGTAFLLNPKMNMSFEVAKGKKVKYYWLSLSGKEVLNYLEECGFDTEKGYIKLHAKNMQAIRRCIFNNFCEENKGKLIDFVFIENFCKIANEIYTSNFNNSPKKNKKYLNHIDNVMSYINDHYHEPDLTLEKIADELYLHKNYLSSLFKQTVGCNFRRYLNQKRMNKAVLLLREGEMSINQVGAAVGIPDPSYFSKIFKKYNGISPSDEASTYLINKLKD